MVECALCSVMADSVTPWSVARQAPLSMEFSRQEYWRGEPFPSTGDLLDLGVEPGSPTLQADSLPTEPPGKPKKQLYSNLEKKKKNLSLIEPGGQGHT